MKDYLDEYIIATRLIHRTQGASIEELSKALDKTPRAVFTILNQLDSMMFPIYDSPDPDNPKKKRYHSEGTFAEYLPSLSFSEEEKAVFNYLVNSSENIPAMQVEARRLLNKIRLMAAERGALIENGNRKPVSIISARAQVKAVDGLKLTRITGEILDAIREKKWVTFRYKGVMSDTAYSYQVFPIVIFTHKGDCYLYIRNKRGKLKVLALERILYIENTYLDTIPTGDEDIYKLLDDPFGFMSDMEETEIVLVVDADQAPFEKAMNWPGSVKLTDNADGSLTIRARTHSCFDLMRWILARTPHIKIISPDWIREDAIQAMRYGIEANTFPEAMGTGNPEDIVDVAGHILEEHLEAFKELAR